MRSLICTTVFSVLEKILEFCVKLPDKGLTNVIS